MVTALSFSRTTSPHAANSVRLVDVFGIALSGLCALHCAVMPVLVGILPAIAGHGAETQFRRVLLVLGLVGVGMGIALHRDRRAISPLLGALLLSALLEVGAVVAEWEVFVSLGIAALLISAHAMNSRACTNQCHGCAPARFWTSQVENLGATKMGSGVLAIASAILVHAVILAIALRMDAPAHAYASSAPSERASLVSNPEPIEIDVAHSEPARTVSVEEEVVVPPSRSSAAPVEPGPAPHSPAPSSEEAKELVAFDEVMTTGHTQFVAVARFDRALSANGATDNVGNGAGQMGSASNGSVSSKGSASNGERASDASSGARLSRPPSQPTGLSARIRGSYPAGARAQGISGVGRARLLVSPEGVVTRAEPLSETPAETGFAQACAEALRGSRGWGEPLDASGRPVSTWIRFSCEFGIRH